jgi:Spy/CpxP family protein refolding chaperone
VRKSLGLAFAALFAVSAAASAQAGGPPVGRGGRLGRAGGGAQRGAQRGGAGGAVGRAAGQPELVRQVRQAFAGVVKRQLALTDDQSRQLDGVEARFEQQRVAMQRSERQARVSLAAAMQDSSAGADQSRVAQSMDQLVKAQHQRADLLEAEQKDLAAFLTPLQRARYLALREQLNRRIQQLRQAGNRGDPPELQ